MLKKIFNGLRGHGKEQASVSPSPLPPYDQLVKLGGRNVGDIVAPVEKKEQFLVSKLGLCNVMGKIGSHDYEDPENTAKLAAIERGQTMRVSRHNVPSTFVYPQNRDPLLPVALPDDTRTVDQSQFKDHFVKDKKLYRTGRLNHY